MGACPSLILSLAGLLFLYVKCPSCVAQQFPQSAVLTLTPPDLELPYSMASRGGNVTVMCTATPGNAVNLFSLKISRVLQSNPNATPTALVDLQHHNLNPQIVYPIDGASAYGRVDQNFLTLRMMRAKCADAANYICEAAYLNAQLAVYTDNDTLSVTVNPGQMTITTEPNFQHWAINNTAVLTCAGPLGTIDLNSKLVWHWEYWDTDILTWRKYDGPSSDIMVLSTNQQPCYSNASASLTRRLQLADSQRTYRCYVQIDGVSAAKFAGQYQFGYVMETTEAANNQYQYGLELGAGIGVAATATFFIILLIIVTSCLCKRNDADTETKDSIRRVSSNTVSPKARTRSVGVQVDIADDYDDGSYDNVDNSLPLAVPSVMAPRPPALRLAPPPQSMMGATPRSDGGSVHDEVANPATAKQLQAAAEDVLQTLLSTRQVTSWRVSGEGGPTSFILNLSPATHPDVTYLGTQLQQGRWHKKRPGAAQRQQDQQDLYGQQEGGKHKRKKHHGKAGQRLALTENPTPFYESPRRYKDTRILF